MSLALRVSVLTVCIVGCASTAPPVHRTAVPPPNDDTPPSDDEAPAEWLAWRSARRESIGGPDGWLTLIGLHWLDASDGPEPTALTVGSDPASSILLPRDRAPAQVGSIRVRDGVVVFTPHQGVTVTVDDAAVDGPIALAPDDPGPPTVLAIGSLRLHSIARGGRLGLRVKDRESPARATFSDLRVFDYDPRFRVVAELVPSAPGEVVPIVNVLGQEVDAPLVARLRFVLEGRALTLLATEGDGGRLMVMMRDPTSHDGRTYGAGRYLGVARPSDGEREVTLDLNFAYTPPCAFTAYATCPLPPPENELPVAIVAGERAPEH